jgi:hypothetical protein
MPNGASAKPGSFERGQGRAGVAGCVARAGGVGELVEVSTLHLISLDTGPDPALPQVYTEGVSVAETSDDSSRRDLGRDERDPGSLSRLGWKPVGYHRDAPFEPGLMESLREEV